MNTLVNTETLIPVVDGEIGGELQPCVDGRVLHGWLKSGEMFSKWIAARIRKYDFIENQDFACHWEISQTQTKGGRKGRARVKKYLLTLDMAKELSMVENNIQGRTARRYFINCEKALRRVESNLMMQFNRALLELEKFSDMASQAGRTLNVIGKQVKPQARERVDALKQKLQPHLPNLEINND